jgi:porin
LAIDRDFIVPELYNTLGSINFLNQTFFYPTIAFGVFDRAFFPVENHSLASTPYATPGMRLRVDFTPQVYLQAGIYGGKADTSYHGVGFPLSRDEGVLCYFETGYKRNLLPDDKGLPGSYKLGGYFHSDSFADNDALLSVFGLPNDGEQHDSNFGLYFLAEQMFFFEGGTKDSSLQGLIGFARAAYSPPDRNFFEWGVDGGLLYRGLVPTRDYDSCGVAFSYISVSNDIRDVQKEVNAVAPNTFPDADFEAVLELNYKAQITPWMTTQLSLQRVFHPGARLATSLPDAWVFIAQSSLRF